MIRFTLLVVSGFTLMTAFNNCSFNQPFGSAEMELGSNSEPPPPDGDTDRIAGEKLYAANCSSCHGAIEVSTKKGRTADQITAAIATQGQMKFLSFLSADDIAKIALALSDSGNGGGDQPRMASNAEVRIGNRFMVYSNLKEIFVADVQDAIDKTILSSLDANIKDHAEAWGGSCTRYDAGCAQKICGVKGSDPCEADLAVKMTATNTPTGSVLRKGYSTRTCEEVLSIDKAVMTALSKSGLKTETQPNPLPNSANISVFMDFYHMGKPTSQTSLDELTKVVTAAQQKGMSTLDQWRFVMLPICESTMADLL